MLRDVTVSCRLAQLSAVVWQPTNRQLRTMCGRVIQSGGPIRYAIVDGIDVHDSRVHNYQPQWNAAPSQELLVIRRNHQTGEVSLDPLRWGLIPYWCQDPKGGLALGIGQQHRSAALDLAAARVPRGAMSPPRQIRTADVRVGSKADIALRPRHVRHTPKADVAKRNRHVR
jgi:hypothetical protein